MRTASERAWRWGEGVEANLLRLAPWLARLTPDGVAQVVEEALLGGKATSDLEDDRAGLTQRVRATLAPPGEGVAVGVIFKVFSPLVVEGEGAPVAVVEGVGLANENAHPATGEQIDNWGATRC